VAVVQKLLAPGDGCEGESISFLQVSVSDSGEGISPEDLERVFLPFERVGRHSGGRHGGAGLGLSLTRELVELHGGRIWAESGGEGKGSLLRFILPLSPHGSRNER
jgi:signal transduction histidine kinase